MHNTKIKVPFWAVKTSPNQVLTQKLRRIGCSGVCWRGEFLPVLLHPYFKMDINMFREDKGGNPEAVRESQRRRFAPVEAVDLVIELDKAWRAGS